MSYRNTEHYADPTAGKAIGNIYRQERRARRRKRRKQNAVELGRSGQRDHFAGGRGLPEGPEKEIMEQIQMIPDPKMQQVLEMHYVYHEPWEAIAEKMDCTESNVYKLHNRALREIKVPDILQDSSKFQKIPVISKEFHLFPVKGL